MTSFRICLTLSRLPMNSFRSIRSPSFDQESLRSSRRIYSPKVKSNTLKVPLPVLAPSSGSTAPHSSWAVNPASEMSALI